MTRTHDLRITNALLLPTELCQRIRKAPVLSKKKMRAKTFVLQGVGRLLSEGQIHYCILYHIFPIIKTYG